MGRPRKRRMVNFEHNVRHFKPSGVYLKDLEEVNVTIDELESMRLSYLKNMKQEDAASKMQIHQSTFQRMLHRTLEKISDALVNGKAIKVEGGDYIMPGKDGTGPAQSGTFGKGRQNQDQGNSRGGRGAGFAGPDGICKCISCGHEQTHQRGMPCTQMKCPECGQPMARK